MKAIPIILFALSVITQPLAAQETASYGYLELVNAVVSEHPLKVEIDGKPLVHDGISSMSCTGGFAMESGAHRASFKVEGLPEIDGNLDVEESKTRIYVIYLKPNPKQKEREERPVVMAIKKVPGPESGKEFQLRVFNLSSNKERFQLNTKALSLEGKEDRLYPGWRGGPLELTRAERCICEALVEEAGTYHLYLSTDCQGEYGATLVRILEYELPPWLVPAANE